ncbi:MAG: sel1 repeat family protein [Proteobacteria bacterium]|nr:sel1 repeat family protein [Pseudomonadota bacterium]
MQRFCAVAILASTLSGTVAIASQPGTSRLEAIPTAQPVSEPAEIRQLADQGQATAQYDLGVMYEYGRGVPQDDAAAVTWYRKAAMQGVDAAQYRLAVMYENGWGVPKNNVEAVVWYRSAAEQGHALAQHDLAFMYVAGKGVPQDYVRAYMWLDIAVSLGNAVMVKHLRRVAGNMTDTQIDEARRLAHEWLNRTGR